MVNDWESAFEACPPYGEGKGAYGPEDTALLTEMERTLEKLLPGWRRRGLPPERVSGGLPPLCPPEQPLLLLPREPLRGPGGPGDLGGGARRERRRTCVMGGAMI